MKFCIVTAVVAKGNGQGRVNYEVTWEALRRGHHVTLVASSIAPDLHHHPHIRWVPINVEQLASALLKEMLFAYQSARWIKKHRAEFDLIKVNGAVTSVRSDANAVHFVHSAWLKSKVHSARNNQTIRGFYHWLYSTLNAYWEKRAFRKTKVVIAVSEQVKQEIIELGIPEEFIQVILNGADIDEFCPGYADRQLLGLPNNVPLALFAGDIRTSRKNLDTVLYALVQVPNLQLVVAADVKNSPYPELAKKLEIDQRVHFIGYRNDLYKLMQAVDLFVFPSRYEACALVLLEAMASGLPIVTARTAGGCEIVTTECGVIMPDPDDVSHLTQVLIELESNLEMLDQMGKASRKVAEQYSWQKQAGAYIDCFERKVATKQLI